MISMGGPEGAEHPCVSIYKYEKISDDTSGTEAIIWTPSAGRSICISSGLVSVDDAGTVEIKDGTTDDTIAVLDFNEKKAVPLTFGIEFRLPKDHTLKAKFTVGAATGNCHISVFGDER